MLVEVALFNSGMQVHCISISEHIWVGGCGPRGVGELPAGGIRASQGTFSSLSCLYMLKCQQFNCWHFNIYKHDKFYLVSAELSMKKVL